MTQFKIHKLRFFGINFVLTMKQYDDLFQATIVGMIEELQGAFANQILDDASWMSEETKQKTLEKLTKMTVNVGYPDWIKEKFREKRSHHRGNQNLNNLLIFIKL